jgi:hypothetical protein
MLLSGCAPIQAKAAAAIPTILFTEEKLQAANTATAANILLPTPEPIFSPTAIQTVTPVVYPSGTDWQVIPGHFILDRPISATNNDSIERSYAFGSTLNGEREVHHGVEFTNPKGTPVLAAADGVVVAAGTDHDQVYGNVPDLYGNLVVIQHHLADAPDPLYTLYGHLSSIQVRPGDQVKSGEIIGLVGKSGKAMGMHLHFEVRSGEAGYEDVMNPELWIKPHSGNGVLVGKIISPDGEIRFMPGIKVVPITTAKKPPTYRPEPYADPHLIRDSVYDEVFVVGDLPAGKYRVTFTPSSQTQLVDVEIVAGMVTEVIIHSKN